MNIQEIRILIDKYYNGQSSEEEEATLRKYFESEIVPSEFETEREIFRFYSKTGSVPEPSSRFESRIIDAVESLESKSSSNQLRRNLIAVMSAAAGLLLLIGSYFVFTGKKEPVDTFSNPQIAYTRAVDVLYEVSEQINRGTRALEPVKKITESAVESVEIVTKSTDMLATNINRMDYFQRALMILRSPMDFNTNKK